MDDITLQINVSAGDIKYAALTVPALVAQHADIKKRLLVVDCCRPPKSRMLDPEKKFPLKEFNLKVEEIIRIANRLLTEGIITDIYFFKPEDPLIGVLSKKYLGNLYKSTHAAGGTGNMSYWLGIEIPTTRYVLHYDADIIAYQAEGFLWVNEALNYLQQEEQAVFAVPRLCPPVADSPDPSLVEGRPFVSKAGFWLNDWFSTRHFLVDKERLSNYLPLICGSLKLEFYLKKMFSRAFPPDPEILLMRSLSPKGKRRVILKSTNAWLLHPIDKGQEFISILPQLLNTVKIGEFPKGQAGFENIKTDIWSSYLRENERKSEGI